MQLGSLGVSDAASRARGSDVGAWVYTAVGMKAVQHQLSPVKTRTVRESCTEGSLVLSEAFGAVGSKAQVV